MKSLKRNKLRIGLDIDGVLADTSTYYLKYMGFKDQSPPKSWNDKRFEKFLQNISPNDKKFWLSIPSLLTKKDIKNWNFKPVVYITARSVPNSITLQWLKNNGYPKAPLMSIGDKPKSIVCNDFNLDIFVDDAPHNFWEINEVMLSGYGKTICLLFDKEYNKNKHIDENLRIHNLNDIVNKFNL